MEVLHQLLLNRVVHAAILGALGAVAVDIRKWKQSGGEFSVKALGIHVGLGALLGLLGAAGFDVTGLGL